jgi:hypothetical protein
VVVGHHERDLLALEAHLVRGQHGLRVGRQRGHPGHAARLEIGAGEHGVDARVLQGRGRVDGHDAGMGERAAQHRAVQRPAQVDVVHEAPLAADEPRVLLAAQAAERRHVSPLAS